MGLYEITLIVIFFIFFVIFLLCSVKACAQAVKEKDKKPRKNFLRKALFLMVSALIFLLCALYIIFRISWFMMVVFTIGTMVVAYIIGTGVAANMHEH